MNDNNNPDPWVTWRCGYCMATFNSKEELIEHSPVCGNKNEQDSGASTPPPTSNTTDNRPGPSRGRTPTSHSVSIREGNRVHIDTQNPLTPTSEATQKNVNSNRSVSSPQSDKCPFCGRRWFDVFSHIQKEHQERK